MLISALNIPDVPSILRHHGLRCVPVDLEIDTLGISVQDLERKITAASRVVLIAHVFGARCGMEPVIAVARRHGLFVIEDCAEVFDGLRFVPGPLVPPPLATSSHVSPMPTAMPAAVMERD